MIFIWPQCKETKFIFAGIESSVESSTAFELREIAELGRHDGYSVLVATLTEKAGS